MAGDAGFSHLVDGRNFRVRVTANASRNEVAHDRGEVADLRVRVTVVAEDGKANAAVIKLLAKALGVPKSRVKLLRGTTHRDKVFQVTD